MLHVAPAPATVAQHVINERGRCFLVGSAGPWQEPNGPTGPTHQTCLDEIMAQDQGLTATAPPQMRQLRAVCKGARANDRVVAPVVALVARPKRQTLRQEPAIDRGR